MTQEDTFLGRLKAPAPPGAVDEAVLAAAQTAAENLKAGNNGRPQPVAAGKKSYDGHSSGKAAGAAKGGAGESPMETITFPCPACGTKYSVPAQHAGKTTPCKKCGANITVPVPQVANPTIIGGTRTIRRSDIEDASTSERAAPVAKRATAPIPKAGMKKATANFGDVDMKGGDSVLRKEETVVQTGPGTRPHPSRVPPPPARGGRPAPVQGGRPAPMPGQPGYGTPKAKNPMPLYLGIGGGALVLVIIVIVIVAMSGPKPGANPGNGGGGTGGGKDGGAAVQVSDDERILKQFENATRNEIGVVTADVKANYNLAKEKAAANGKFVDKFKDYKNQFANLLAKRMGESGAGKADVREVALLLYNDGYQDIARPLLDKARTMMTSKDRYRSEEYTSVGENGEPTKRTREVPRDEYKSLCELLGFVEYKWPEDEFSDYYRWEIPQWTTWEKKRQEISMAVGGDMFFTKTQYDEIKVLEDALIKAGKELRDQDKADGFAIAAREAFIRFKQKNADTNKRAMFSPKMLQRDGEKFEEVWGYTYWKPFIVYVEIAPGRDVDDLKKSFATKANLLMQEEKWFRKHIVEAFGLKRVLPFEGPLKSHLPGLVGKKFETPGELAEAEGWPLEINVLKDGQTFQQFLQDQMGGGIPGARAFYSNPLKHVVTWDDPAASEGDDQAWFNECVLIHECFHMLTDHYAANPVEWKWEYSGEKDPNGLRKRDWKPIQNKARLFNVFVQEGLTDSVAGFEKEGDGANAKYSFLMHNRARIPYWQQTYEQFGKQNLFRVRDLLDCVHYGHFGPVGNRCWDRIGMKKKMGGYPRDAQQAYFGIYYAAACQASAFLYHYKENGSYKYREKWMRYIKMDYAGEVDRGEYTAEPGIKAFKEAFGIKSDADFDTIEAELVKWNVTLKADGSDDQMDKDSDAMQDAPDLPEPEGYAPRANEQWALLREEQKLAA
jgi:hypothetical protein